MEEKDIEIWTVCELILKGEIFMSTLSRKLNKLFKESAQLRKLSDAEAEVHFRT